MPFQLAKDIVFCRCFARNLLRESSEESEYGCLGPLWKVFKFVLSSRTLESKVHFQNQSVSFISTYECNSLSGITVIGTAHKVACYAICLHVAV